jgi:hypothetical protein
LAEKKTWPVKLGGDWVHGMWKNVEYVLADKGRKHHKRQRVLIKYYG